MKDNYRKQSVFFSHLYFSGQCGYIFFRECFKKSHFFHFRVFLNPQKGLPPGEMRSEGFVKINFVRIVVQVELNVSKFHCTCNSSRREFLCLRPHPKLNETPVKGWIAWDWNPGKFPSIYLSSNMFEKTCTRVSSFAVSLFTSSTCHE